MTEEHQIENEIRRFDPDFYIAESWQRLAFAPENIQSHDLLLLKHEIFEISLVLQGQYTQKEAHDAANIKYNYSLACFEYYQKLKEEKDNGDSERN